MARAHLRRDHVLDLDDAAWEHLYGTLRDGYERRHRHIHVCLRLMRASAPPARAAATASAAATAAVGDPCESDSEAGEHAADLCIWITHLGLLAARLWRGGLRLGGWLRSGRGCGRGRGRGCGCGRGRGRGRGLSLSGGLLLVQEQPKFLGEIVPLEIPVIVSDLEDALTVLVMRVSDLAAEPAFFRRPEDAQPGAHRHVLH